jgi:nitrate reductase gamma subunit
LFLPARASAISNLVLGVPLGAFGLFAMVSEAAEGALHPHVVLAGVGAVVAWLIVGLSIVLLRRLSHGQTAMASAAGDTTRRGG